MSVDQVRNLLRRDLDPDFLEKIAIGLGWSYPDLYERIAANRALPDDLIRNERFNKLRYEVATDAIANAAQKCGVPHGFRRLGCNGQHKLLVKAGSCILIHEPVATFGDRPDVADYKRDLADAHGFVRQLELDLGDQPLRIRDWSGSVLGVILHGAAGPNFKKEHKELGGLMVAVPDSAYQQWVVRFDLLNLALFGRDGFDPSAETVGDDAHQEDNVVVRLKKKIDKETA